MGGVRRSIRIIGPAGFAMLCLAISQSSASSQVVDPPHAEHERADHRSRLNPRLPNTGSFWSTNHGLVGSGDLFDREGGGIYRTRNSGETFRQVLETERGVAWIETAGTEHAWAALQAGYHPAKRLLYTNDGGETWRRLPASPVWAPSFASPSHGIAIGSRDQNYGGAVLSETRVVITSDGGRTWARVKRPCRLSGATVAMGSTGNAWAVCVGEPSAGTESKSIFRTQDSATTWQQVAAPGPCPPSPCGSYAQSLSFDAADDGALLTSYGASFTTDGGKTWRSRRVGEGRHSIGAISVQQLTRDDVVGISGGYGWTHLVASSDGGRNWEIRHRWRWRR